MQEGAEAGGEVADEDSSLEIEQLSHSSSKQDTPLFAQNIGELQRLLGEYDHRYETILEGNFVQVNKNGKLVNVCSQPPILTLGIAAMDPLFSIPNVLLVAEPELLDNQEDPAEFEEKTLADKLKLRKLFPLKLVKLSVSDVVNHRLQLRLANGCVFYLQLYSPTEKEDDLLKKWDSMIQVLNPQSLNYPDEYKTKNNNEIGDQETTSDSEDSRKDKMLMGQTSESGANKISGNTHGKKKGKSSSPRPEKLHNRKRSKGQSKAKKNKGVFGKMKIFFACLGQNKGSTASKD
ncbi:Golgi-associated RAB2 interactor protein 6-like [Discoglossus pictus]